MHYINYYLFEIRIRLFYILFACLFNFFISYTYKYELFYLFSKPFFLFRTHFLFFEIPEALSILIRISIIGTIVTTLPFIIYEIWRFFIPSFYTFQRKIVTQIGILVVFFFVLEFVFIYWFFFPKFCEFLLSFEMNSPSVTLEYMPRIDSYIKVTTKFFLLVLGLFQLPFCFLFLFFRNSLTWKSLWKQRKLVFFICLLFSAFVSPPDFFSQLFIFFTLYFLYEIILFIGIIFQLQELETF